jgi:hypothetical protein
VIPTIYLGFVSEKPSEIAYASKEFVLMDYIEKALEKLREWVDRVIDALFGPEPQHEPELIPIPVDEPRR